MRKQVLFLLIFICTHLCSHAQYFDWVQTYTGSEAAGITSTNCIKQSVTDKDGNVYFIGCCSTDAGFHNNKFLPFNPYGPGWNTTCLVIGKLSANGDLLWNKIVHANNYSPHGSGRIQLSGDTALVSLLEINLPVRYPRSRSWPRQSMNYLFYLDTLMTFYIDDTVVHHGVEVFCHKNFDCNSATAYVVFDLNGNIKEEHWITASLLNRQGIPFDLYDSYPSQPDWDSIVPTRTLWMESFYLDESSNIVLTRRMRDYVYIYDSVSNNASLIGITDSIVGGVRFYVDGKRYFDVPLPDVRPSAGRHNYQILKFSPHFEELLASQFLFEPTPEHLDTICESEINELKCDKDNNLYLVVSSNYLLTETGESNRLKIGGSDSLWLRFLEYDHNKGFLVKYDSALNPVYLRYFERDSSLELSGPGGLASGLRASHFDEDGNFVFVGGTTTSDSLITSCYFGGNEVGLNKMFVRINPEDGSGVTFGDRMHSEMVAIGSNDIVDVVAKNNRIIQQVKYRWWLDFAGERYEKAEATQWGMGFAVWDYDGNELCFVDYGINGSLNNGIRSICLVDSVLYLTGMLASGGAQFGNVTVYNSGSSQSFIARYVDTAFMHPYVRPGGLQDIQLVVRDGEPVATVYPNPCAQRVTVDWNGDEPPLAATVTDITGRTYSVALAAAGAGQSDSEAKIAGRYSIDFSSLPAANYLLTLTTPSGHSVTTRLLKR